MNLALPISAELARKAPPIWGLSWAILGPSWAYLGLPGPSWAHFRLTWALLGHLGASWPTTWLSIGAMLGHLVTNEVPLDHVVVTLGPLPSTRAGGMREAMNKV